MTQKSGSAGVLGCFTLLSLLPVSMALNGLVFRSLWGWFAVPQFHLAPVSVPMAIGLSELVGLVVAATPSSAKTEGETVAQIVGIGAGQILGRPLLYLLLGYLVHLCL